MIISRTPFRISFVGGGTDLRSFYAEEPGQVLSTSIDKYIYVVVKRQLGIVEYKYRVNWSQVEFCNHIEDISHPIIREALQMMEIDFPVEITTFADIPAGTGLGSSSAFAVGLMHALYALKGQNVTKYQLAEDAASIEVGKLKRTMGKQDHFASSYGDLNVITFFANEAVSVDPVFYSLDIHRQLEERILLFYTRVKRNASDVLQVQDRKTPKRREVLRSMKKLVAPLRNALSESGDISLVGEILHENWQLKRSLTDIISSSEIDAYYDVALGAGATGGKLLGAGGGGFLMFYVEPEYQAAVIDSLGGLFNVRVGLDTSGTRITYYDQTDV